MKVLIIGASGKTGALLVAKSLEKDYQVRVYARNTSVVSCDDKVEVTRGDIADVNKLSKSMVGVDAVLVALGNKVNQISKPLFVTAIPNIIKAMEIANVKRIINLSALGVGDTYKNAGFPCNIFARSILKANFEDHAKGEECFVTSELEWTTIHPALLYTGREQSRKARVFNLLSKEEVLGLSLTSRHDIASLMLDIINDKSTYRQALILVSKRIF